MNWFENIKRWYEAGLWTEQMVRNAVTKGKLSPEECTLITEQGA